MDALLPVATHKTGKSIEILSRTWPLLTRRDAQRAEITPPPGGSGRLRGLRLARGVSARPRRMPGIFGGKNAFGFGETFAKGI